jgi:transcription elongation factor GreA
MTKKYQMTLDGKKELEEELENLLTVKRQEVIERIQIARGFGDLSENSEYDAARNEQATIEARIQAIEDMLQNAEIVKVKKSNVVQFGSTVTYKEVATGNVETYKIVGTAESNPLSGKISSDAPIAKALEGKEKGARIQVVLPNNKEIEIEIIEIE